MSRAISTSAQQEINASQSGTCWLTIIKIKHASMDDICVVNNNEIITYDGVDYYPYAFSFTPPRQVEGTMQPSKLTIDNVSREITQAIRAMVSPPVVETAIIMVALDGTITKEAGWWVAELSNVSYNAMQITGSISFNISVRDILSTVSYSPLLFPGLY